MYVVLYCYIVRCCFFFGKVPYKCMLIIIIIIINNSMCYKIETLNSPNWNCLYHIHIMWVCMHKGYFYMYCGTIVSFQPLILHS